MFSLEKLRYKYIMLDISGKLITWIVGTSLLAWLLKFAYLPAFEQLALPGIPRETLLQPWSLLTYGFLHNGIFHLLFNMLVLNTVGRSILNVLGGKPFLSLFLMGVLAGGIGFTVATFFAPIYFSSAYMVGASAGVYALLFLLCFYMPDTEVRLIVWNVKLLYIAYALLAFDVFAIIGRSNAGGSVAHLMGAALGYVAAQNMQNGNDITSGFRRVLDFFNNLISGSYTKQKKSPLKTVFKNKAPQAYARNPRKSSHQEQIDVVLDKISTSGYESLTAAEKEVLFKAGKQ
jgi:membrane associated rhomboid family serine protease